MKIFFLRPMKVTSEAEHHFLFPIFKCKNQLRDLGYKIEFKNKVENSLLNCDILCVLSTCIRRHSNDNVYMDGLRKISESAKLTYFFDISDSCGVIYDRGIEIGDIYYKKQLYHDKLYYTDTNTREPRMHFDYVLKNSFIKKYSSNLSENYSYLSNVIFDKMKISWNLGLGDYRTFSIPSKIGLRSMNRLQTKMFRKPIDLPTFRHRYFFCEFSERNVDLLSSFGSYDHESKPIFLHRKASADIAASLKGNLSVESGFHSIEEYLLLLRRAKMALSPFGWGEINLRDFETFMNGIALLKPRMNHLDTWPDYYIENETYLPYKWDASDLKELIEHVVSDESYLEEIARYGQERFRSFGVQNDPNLFIERFRTVFS